MATLYANGWVVTMDDASTEHERGWVLVDGRAIEAVGAGEEPPHGTRVDLGGAVVTPGLVNTHHHLYQTLTRARAQQADLFTWLRELYPVWAGIDAEAEYAAARTGLAELALSGCTTVFDHHYVFPRGRPGIFEAEVEAARELGVRLVASRGSMDLGASDGGLPPDELVEDIDAVLAETERLHAAFHEDGPGARVQVAVAPCSPFSVTGRLMEESATLARRLGLVLHTHLAETLEEDAYCRELYGCTPVEYLERLGWLADDVWCAHCVHLSEGEVARFARDGHGRRPLPDLEPAARCGRRARACPARRRRTGRAGRRRVGVERAERPLPRGEAGAARRPRPRRRRGDDGARRTPPRDARKRRGAAPRRHRVARARQAGRPRDLGDRRPRARRGRRSRRGLVLSGPHRVDRLVVGGEDVVRGGALVRASAEEIARTIGSRREDSPA